MVSEGLCPELSRLVQDGAVTAQRRRYRTGDLQGAFVAVAATDDRASNLQVSSEARGASVLVNVVDDAENSDFIVPSVINRGDITVAVSTAGRSPALARKIRARLEREFGAEYAELAVMVGEVRSEVKGRGTTVSADAWQKALDVDRMLDLLKKGEREQAKTVLRDNLEKESKV